VDRGRGHRRHEEGLRDLAAAATSAEGGDEGRDRTARAHPGRHARDARLAGRRPIVVRGERDRKDSTDTQETRIEDADALAGARRGLDRRPDRALGADLVERAALPRPARRAGIARSRCRCRARSSSSSSASGMRPADFRLVDGSRGRASSGAAGRRANAQRPIAGAAGESSSEPAGIFPDRNAVFESEAARNDVAKKNGLTEPYRPIGE
jgi:hypothetical protein